MENFLSFIEKLRKSEKPVVRQLYGICHNDCRTTTWSNLRNILLLTSESSVDDVCQESIKDLIYKELKEDETWKIGLIHEIIEMKLDSSLLPNGWQRDDIEEILVNICTY